MGVTTGVYCQSWFGENMTVVDNSILTHAAYQYRPRFGNKTGYVPRNSHLVEAGINPDNCSLAVYFNGSKVEHVGIVGSEGRITSKWGIGNLYEHQPMEVPYTYGKDVRYFSALDPDVAYELLEKHHRGA